jgi:hypothetical protein
MTADYPTDTASATAEYVFDLFRDSAAVGSPRPAFADVADEPASLHCGRSAHELGWALEEILELDISDDELVRALEPWNRRTVREVCEFLAARMTRPVIRPWKHVAGDCLPAGAFLTVRSMFVEAGADPAEITPSTPLGPYLWLYHDLVPDLTRLAPDRVPPLTEGFSLPGVLCVVLAPVPLFLVMLLSKWGIELPVWVLLATIFGALPFTVSGIVLLLRAERRPPLGELETFRDLAYCLAGQEPRRRIQTTS